MNLTQKIFSLLVLVCGFYLNTHAQYLSLTGDTIVEQGDNENYTLTLNFNPPCTGRVVVNHNVQNGTSYANYTLIDQTVSSSINQSWTISVDWIDNIGSPTTGRINARFSFFPANNAPSGCSAIGQGKTLLVVIDDD